LPTIVFTGREPVLAYGSHGGRTIINSVFNATLNLVDHCMRIQQAINAPLWSFTSATVGISRERVGAFQQPGFSIATQDALHVLGQASLGAAATGACTAAICSVRGIVIDLKAGRQYSGADARRDGSVIGLKPSRAEGPKLED
jgi:gamma-glutamyltranspeptidase/glutathione hydrolase